MIEINNTSTIDDLKKKYVFSDRFINGLEVGFRTNNNFLAFGPGGHGKSEIALDFFRSKGIEPFVFCLGNGTSIDRLLGGLNTPKFTTSGEMEYLVENSFLNHEYAILEEVFDAPAEVLEQLKDILSSGILRQGVQQFKIKTKYIVACSNKTRTDFTKGSASLKALMERFPLEVEVKWDNYNSLTYGKLIENSLGKPYANPFITYLLEEFVKQKVIISPRIALKSAELFFECGIDCLDFIGDFLDKKDILDKSKESYKFKINFEQYKQEATDALNNYEKLKLIGTQDQLLDVEAVLNNILFKTERLKSIPDSYVDEFAEFKRKLKLEMEGIKKAEALDAKALELEEDSLNF